MPALAACPAKLDGSALVLPQSGWLAHSHHPLHLHCSEKCDFQRPLEDLDDTMTVVTVADMPDYQRRYALEPLVRGASRGREGHNDTHAWGCAAARWLHWLWMTVGAMRRWQGCQPPSVRATSPLLHVCACDQQHVSRGAASLAAPPQRSCLLLLLLLLPVVVLQVKSKEQLEFEETLKNRVSAPAGPDAATVACPVCPGPVALRVALTVVLALPQPSLVAFPSRAVPAAPSPLPGARHRGRAVPAV